MCVEKGSTTIFTSSDQRAVATSDKAPDFPGLVIQMNEINNKKGNR
jgi:hypothetical protein